LAYLVGTDEAGYGPNLGPLVVSASVWEVPEGIACAELRPLLADVVVATPGAVSASGPPRLAIGDSKVLYQSHHGLHHLERGLWAALALLGHRPTTWREVWDLLAPGQLAEEASRPWHAAFDRPVPLDAQLSSVDPAAEALRAGLARHGVRLVALRSRALFPRRFNGDVAARGSKGSTLSHLTLGLIADLLAPCTLGSISVVCDKHGGRNRYEGLLFEHFPQSLIEVQVESRDLSRYQFGPPERRIDFSFQAKAESHLPTALASMASKYLRELSMRAWNDFWCSRIEGLAPTAGYPGDARRFHQAIAPVQAQLGIDDDVIWRWK
jgi:hypothetical protein